MDLLCLLDKNYKLQVTLLQKLLDSPDPIPKKELIQELNVTKFIFESALEELTNMIKELGINLAIHSYNQMHISYLQLEKKHDVNLTDLYVFYLNQSLDFQILHYLYQKQTYSVSELSDLLAVSSAVVYRRISGLNRFLQSFGLQLKNGKLHGDKLRICYFFYHFFWHSLPSKDIKQMSYQTKVHFMLDRLQKELAQKFSKTNRLKMYLWVDIIAHQNSLEHHPATFSDELLHDIISDPIYLNIRKIYCSKDAQDENGGDEIQAIYFYFFVTSMFILTPTTWENAWATYLPEVAKLNEIATDFQARCSSNLDAQSEEWRYILSQAHSQMYFFNSYVFSKAYDNFTMSSYMNKIIPEPITSLATQAYERVAKTSTNRLSENTKKNMVWLYASLIQQSYSSKKTVITIGVFSHVDYLKTTILLQRVNDLFSWKYPIQCQVAQPEKHYDLLIVDSDYVVSDFYYNKVYLLTDLETQVDVQSINHLIDQLYTVKNLALVPTNMDIVS
jgi:predicted transcriptional regulator